MGGERSGWQTEEGMEGRREVSVMWRQPQRTRLAIMAVLVLVVWLAAPADMDRRRGTGGFSGAKQPQGSANEGTSLCGEGGKSIRVTVLIAHTCSQTRPILFLSNTHNWIQTQSLI